MKVIENMKPWEVMKAHEDGKRVATKAGGTNLPNAPWVENNHPIWNWNFNDYTIIKDQQPELTAEWWDGFDWGFFNQYGGVCVIFPDGPEMLLEHVNSIKDVNSADIGLRDSPRYPWFGGKCPVPDNVEVEVLLRNEQNYVDRADGVNWKRGAVHTPGDIIAFCLTGKLVG